MPLTHANSLTPYYTLLGPYYPRALAGQLIYKILRKDNIRYSNLAIRHWPEGHPPP